MSAPEPLPDCYEGDPDLLPPGEAMRRIRAHVRPVETTESVPVIDALGRVAARDVVSPMNVPGHTNSAMDGYACAGGSLPDENPCWYAVLGTAFAGKPFAGRVGPRQAVRVMTGAVMPEGTDTVIMQEHVEVDGDRVQVPPGASAGQHVRQAGEDIGAGAVVVPRGRRLMPAEMGLLASLGIAEADVFRRLRVAYFSTGDEIRPPAPRSCRGSSTTATASPCTACSGVSGWTSSISASCRIAATRCSMPSATHPRGPTSCCLPAARRPARPTT